MRVHQLLRCPHFVGRLTGKRSLLSPAASLSTGRRAETTGASGVPSSSPSPATSAPHPKQADKLYRMVEVEVRGHDKAVLDSYQTFTTTAAQQLEIPVHETWEDWRHIEKRTLLRSAFVNKKCREQYENRTYFRTMQFKYLTGSTADTFLEYIQRNLPEGVSMRVARHQLELLPQHLRQAPSPTADRAVNQEQ